MSGREYLSKALGKARAHEFLIWAFGPLGPEIAIPCRECISLWNERHGEKLRIVEAGKLTVDLPKMAELWLDEIVAKEKGHS